MQYIKCQNCGNEVPEGSAFCNKCGAPIVSKPAAPETVECPHCHAQIPATAMFCPKCGKATTTAPAGNDTAKNEWDGKNGAQQPDTPADDHTPSERKRARNIILALVIVGFLGLILVRNCFFSGNSQPTEAADTAAVTTDSIQDSNAIFVKALQDNNFGGDGATVVYAIRVPGGDTGNPDHIVGLTFQSGQGGHTFYKIYDLTQNGSNWEIQLAKTTYLDGQNITFDAGQLMADPSTLPQSTVIDGKRYVYFAYMAVGSGSSGHVSLNLYDIDTKQVVSQNYDGEYKTLDDGQQHIVCMPKSGSGQEFNFINGQVPSIGILHIKTQDEIDAEKQEKEQADEEAEAKEMEAPANSASKWASDNTEAMTSLKKGTEVTLRSSTYDKDKPLFRSSDLKSKIANGAYVVFLTNGGVVYAFNKSEGKNFVVYAGNPKATNIGFENSDKNIINVRTASGLIEYNLYTNRAKLKK